MDETHGAGEMEGIHMDSEELETIPQSPVILDIPPPSPPHLPATDWSRSYVSNFTDFNHEYLDAEDLKLLRQMNCSYLSSRKAPTLLALKRHAQSLANLIRKISTSTKFGGVDGWLDGAEFHKNEAFDWLNDLSVPYENDDDMHHLPLWALQNRVAYEDEIEGVTHACPLTKVPDYGPFATHEDGSVSPYMSDGALLKHANRCLEIIDERRDHCGGLLSVLDPDGFQREETSVTEARYTLLGQWLMYQQHQASRMRELEISYANALDALAGEAIIPQEVESNGGWPTYNDPKQTKFQGQYILGHINDTVTAQIHKLLDNKEQKVQEDDEIAYDQGVSGGDMWAGSRSRGLVWIDEPTRYCRLKNTGSRSPIFIIPISEQHSGTRATRELERRPARLEVVRRDAASQMGEQWRIRADLREATERANQYRQERDQYRRLNQALKTERDTLQTEKEAWQTEKNTWQNEKYGLQAQKEYLQTEKNALQRQKDAQNTPRQSGYGYGYGYGYTPSPAAQQPGGMWDSVWSQPK